jgi:hypothetical protein
VPCGSIFPLNNNFILHYCNQDTLLIKKIFRNKKKKTSPTNWSYFKICGNLKQTFFFIHVQDLVGFRYRQCCDYIVLISTIDFPYTSTCTYDVDIVESTKLWRYRVDIDNWILINLFMYLRLLLQTSKIVLSNRLKSTTGYLALNYQFYQS